MQKYIIAFLFLCLHGMARGQTEGNQLYYWFDSDHGSLYSGSPDGGYWIQTIDASHLEEGLHTFYAITTDVEGRVSAPVMRQFFKIGQNDNKEKYSCLCYIDDELFHEEKMSAEGGLLSLDLDASELSEGLHRIQLQVITASGTLSSVYNGFFLRTGTKQNQGKLRYMCFVDDELFLEEMMPAEGGLLSLDLDASALSEGLHHIQFQVITESGVSSTAYNGAFIKVTSSESQGNYSCMYALDDNTEGYKSCAVGRDGTFHLDLDMSEISSGLHHITYFLINDNGTCSSAQTRFFFKDVNAIAQYEYWLNDDSTTQNTIKLPTPKDSVNLITMLPVETVPLRSQCFYFELNDNQPMIYPKNDFHIRFTDVVGRFNETTELYVDYAAGQKLEGIETLESGVTAITETPEENGIEWYQLTALEEYRLAFKTDSPCTIQLFAPSGSEAYNAIGSKATKWGGLLTQESGTYYLALHDVTDQKAVDISIDYILRQHGDVNGDNSVNVADIAIIIDVMARVETNPVSEYFADINSDGNVDVADIASVISIMAARARLQNAMED